jgi:phage terminase large subunit-like protein
MKSPELKRNLTRKGCRVLGKGDVGTPEGIIPARLMRTPADWQAVNEGCWYDLTAATRVVRFFNEFLCHSKGEWAGKNFVLLDWQEWEVVRPLFGWKRPDGIRRFRRAYIEVPKKNGKSTLAAGIALYLLKADGEFGAEVYSAAADREQAAIVYKEAANMVHSSPALEDILLVTDSRKTISDPATRSWYKALSADVKTKEGLNIHGLIFDELHAQPNRLLWDALKYGGAARRQPLFISITTAGTDRNGICYEQHKYTRGVMDGSVRDVYFFGVIFSAPDDADWKDPKVWEKANPSWGSALRVDQFKEDFTEAEHNVGSQNSFRRYRLNQWTEQEVRWLDMGKWKACPDKAPELERKTVFFGGLDLASTQDITAFVMLFGSHKMVKTTVKDPETGKEKQVDVIRIKDIYVKCHFFIPEEQMRERVKRDKVPYDVWQKKQWLTVTRGNMVDEDHIVKVILEECGRHKCKEIAYDRWNASHVVTRLTDEGITMVPIGQGFASLSYPAKELEKLVVGEVFNHGGNPILEWMARNVTIETDSAGGIKPSKKRSTEKIDGIIGTVMAINRYLAHLQPKKSKYETQDPLVIGAAADDQGTRLTTD